MVTGGEEKEKICIENGISLHNSISLLHLQSQNEGFARRSFSVEGSLAQLVQSICLTSRGSGVRTPQLPQKKQLRKRDCFFAFGG